MNKRILTVVMIAAVVSTSTGCTPFRNFFFGRGARCGLCTRLSAPFRRQAPVTAPAQPTCNQPTCIQPQYTPLAAGCGCEPGVVQTPGYGQPGTVSSACPCDPYSGAVGNGVILGNGQPAYGGTWYPSDRERYRAEYMGYPDMGYKIDNDGARIISEDPLPAGAQAVN